MSELAAVAPPDAPAAIGPFCVPPVNLKEHVGKREMNVNMVTCGGQATIPMVAAVSRVQPVSYGEIVATGAAKRWRIDDPGTDRPDDATDSVDAKCVGRVVITELRLHEHDGDEADHGRDSTEDDRAATEATIVG